MPPHRQHTKRPGRVLTFRQSGMMKILITTPDLSNPGGVAHYYRVLRKYLPRDTDYFTVGRRKDEPGLGVIRFIQDVRRFRRTLPVYDVVHVNPSLAGKAIVRDGLFVRAAKKQKKKVVVFVRGWDNAFEVRLKKRWLGLFKTYYFNADAFIVLAKEFENSLREMGYAGPIYMETTAVDDSVFEANGTVSGKPDRGFNILFLTRIVKAKGIYETLDAYASLSGKYPDITLTITGDGDELEAVRQHIQRRKLRGVHLTGYLSGGAKLKAFRHADCYVFPTTHGEGMPNSVLEAMASGLPVITRPAGGLKDFFEHGKMGYLTESLDPRVYADLIETLILDPQLRRRMGGYNHDYAKQRFMASSAAGRLMAIYQAVNEA